jgi:hypothetical protein
MSRRVLFGVVYVVVSVVQLSVPAAANDCIEVAQIRQCAPVATGQCVELPQVKYCAPA